MDRERGARQPLTPLTRLATPRVGAPGRADDIARTGGEQPLFKWLTRPMGRRAAYDRLVRLLRGDESAAERLIAYEVKRAPRLSREEATRQALDRLVHERTR